MTWPQSPQGAPKIVFFRRDGLPEDSLEVNNMLLSDGLELDSPKEEEFLGKDKEGEKDVRKNRAKRGG